MATMINDTRLARVEGVAQRPEAGEGKRFAYSTWLDELPGAAFAIITLVYIVGALMSLV